MRWNQVACTASPKLGLAFLMVPKVVTTSLAKIVLEAEGEKVSDKPNIIHRMRKGYDIDANSARDRYFTISFVRNPFDRFYAAWKNKVDENDLRLRKLCGGPISFEKFVRFIELQGPEVDGHTALQSDFVYGRTGAPLADFIGRYEELEDDWAFLRGLFPQLPPLPWLNSSRCTSDYREAYTPDLVQRVAEIYKEDLEKLEYDFGGTKAKKNITAIEAQIQPSDRCLAR